MHIRSSLAHRWASHSENREKLVKALHHTHRILWIRSTKKTRLSKQGQLLGCARATSDGALTATIWGRRGMPLLSNAVMHLTITLPPSQSRLVHGKQYLKPVSFVTWRLYHLPADSTGSLPARTATDAAAVQQSCHDAILQVPAALSHLMAQGMPKCMNVPVQTEGTAPGKP